MTVKTLIEKLSHYNKDAIVRLHHREGEELLFALTFRNDDITVVLETENDNDMREEIQARFDAALEDGKDELDVYSEMLETGIDIKMVRKYLGDDVADHMKDFCVGQVSQLWVIKDLIEKRLNDMGETGVEVRVSK